MFPVSKIFTSMDHSCIVKIFITRLYWPLKLHLVLEIKLINNIGL